MSQALSLYVTLLNFMVVKGLMEIPEISQMSLHYVISNMLLKIFMHLRDLQRSRKFFLNDCHFFFENI